MNLLPVDLTAATASATERLTESARATARAGASGSSARAMATAAREAVFADALLGAVRARLSEFKTVAK